MRLFVLLSLAPLLAAALPLAPAGAAEPRIEFNLATESGLQVTGTQQWLEALQGLGLSRVSIRAAQPRERPQIKNVGSEASPSYEVTGIITRGGALELPGGSFQRTNKAGIAAWIEKVKEGHDPSRPTAVVAFGLSPEELVDVHKKLSAPVTISTKGASAAQAARQIANGTPLSVTIAPAARAKLADNFTLQEEMQGLSTGTALAAALRPLGLVVAPRKTAGVVSLAVVEAREAPESWPVGWPAEKPPGEVAPGLFKYLTVEIGETPLPEALGAIEGRIGAPLLYDHNGLARAGIDLEETIVSLPEMRTFYKRVLDRLLTQARLKSEVRVDEAGNGFIWISPLRP